MLIRTQDRRSLVDIDKMIINLVTDSAESSTQCAIVAEKLDIIKLQLLGIYSTEDKALKVLDMIQGEYLSANYQYVHNVVFEMPADETDDEV